MKVIEGATSGFVAGTIWGTVVATWNDVPRVEGRVALPGLIRTLKMMGNHGLTFAAIVGVYIGAEQLVQNYRMKRDFVNGAVGGFVAGAAVLGLKGRSVSTAISAGAGLATTSALIDMGGQTTKKRPNGMYGSVSQLGVGNAILIIVQLCFVGVSLYFCSQAELWGEDPHKAESSFLKCAE